MEEWASFIGNVGFPVFISIYLLMRLDKLTTQMIDSLEELKKFLKASKGE